MKMTEKEEDKIGGWVYCTSKNSNNKGVLDKSINNIYPDVDAGSRAKRWLNRRYGKQSSQNKII